MDANSDCYFRQIVDCISSDPSLTLSQLSTSIGSNRKSLQATIKRHTGKTFHELRSACSLCRSLRILAEQKRVKYAAIECGYRHPSNFSRAFKAFFGFYPTEYLDTLSNGPKMISFCSCTRFCSALDFTIYQKQ